MGCQQSSDGSSFPAEMDATSILALPATFRSSATRIHQEEVVDHLSTQPPSPISSRDIFPSPSHPDSVLPSSGSLFNDRKFPADVSSLSPDPTELWKDVLWLRPHQLCARPKLFVDGVHRGDVKQGILGDCWLLSACTAVAKHQHILERVIDPLQPLYGPEYHGMLIFRFWRFGEWVEVCIDDRLPTRNGKLVFASCTHADEFWLPLLEKAFAKIHGSYISLEGGHAGAAFADLTGAIAERLSVQECTFHQLDAIFQHGAFVTCAGSEDSEISTGLVHGHAYTLTGVLSVSLSLGGSAQLVRLRSPWADGVEWKGAWSDRSQEWEAVTTEDKERHSVQTSDDGEFWMAFQDFQERFREITVATLGPDFDRDGATDTHRQYDIAKGSWSEKSAGGSRNDLEKFQENPQYLLRLGASQDNSPGNLLIGLMQLPNGDAPLLPIAFFVYKTESGMERLLAEYFLCVEEEANSGPFTDSWEVLVRAYLMPGDYVIIPATFFPDCHAHFLLRIFAVAPFQLFKLDEQDELKSESG